MTHEAVHGTPGRRPRIVGRGPAPDVAAMPSSGSGEPFAFDAVASDRSRHAEAAQQSLTIDCDRCAVRGIGCGDCMVTVLLGGPPDGVELDEDERRAIEVLVRAGLVPPLRMVTPLEAIQVLPQ